MSKKYISDNYKKLLIMKINNYLKNVTFDTKNEFYNKRIKCINY